MSTTHQRAPSPDLRIVPTQALHPHEEHDSQRAQPLIKRLRTETVVINPPLVAPMDDGEFVILDGANRCYALAELDYPHTLVQVATYDGGYVELDTWQHVVCDWYADEFSVQLHRIPEIALCEGAEENALAHILLRDGPQLAVVTPDDTPQKRNALLNQIVRVYQRQAVLHRTVARTAEEVWKLYPTAVALVTFAHYTPDDIMTAARLKAFLPPGVTRHIVHGRAVRVNYPLAALRDSSISLDEKNRNLDQWMQQKLANREVRYYAEATYQFDE